MYELHQRRLFMFESGLRAACSTVASRMRRLLEARGRACVDIFLCVVDHFEPAHGKVPKCVARQRLDDWLSRYPKIARSFRDAEGHCPAHGFFYPWDEYDQWEFEDLAALCHDGYGELEVHLHHQDDTEASLRAKLRNAVTEFSRHGALSRWPDGRPAWGFIHGNWALDNSRVECGRNFCGVNNELLVLQQEGCYADFTFPAWRHSAQPRQVNSIFYAVDDPGRAKSYDRGRAACRSAGPGEGLLLVQGPLVPFIRCTSRGRELGMDDSDLADCRRYDPARLDRWVSQGIHVRGRPDEIYIKLHCHGAPEGNRRVLLDEDLPGLFADAEARYNDGKQYRLHYVTAREMYNLVRSAELGSTAPIEERRNFVLPRPGLAGN